MEPAAGVRQGRRRLRACDMFNGRPLQLAAMFSFSSLYKNTMNMRKTSRRLPW
jgi:hypothetical protein